MVREEKKDGTTISIKTSHEPHTHTHTHLLKYTNKKVQLHYIIIIIRSNHRWRGIYCNPKETMMRWYFILYVLLYTCVRFEQKKRRIAKHKFISYYALRFINVYVRVIIICILIIFVKLNYVTKYIYNVSSYSSSSLSYCVLALYVCMRV
jgi:hypothetical protein